MKKGEKTMKRFHIAIGVEDIEASIKDYTKKLGASPVLVIKESYALFRTDTLNVSIRKVEASQQGVRHFGWESDDYEAFTTETDVNGILWEFFPQQAQIDEIKDVWPDAESESDYLKAKN